MEQRKDGPTQKVSEEESGYSKDMERWYGQQAGKK